MYNRYIPQPDGSYSKNRVADPAPPPPRPQPNKQQATCDPPSPPPPPCDNDPKPKAPPCRQGIDAGDFLRRLLPKNMDTGDLLVIILLLLMAGDNTEDKNNALLTLALYLFM